MVEEITQALHAYKNSTKALHAQRFFKTGKGEYGEGDHFIGATVPEIRAVARTYYQRATLGDIEVLLKSPIHEERLLSLILLVEKNKRASPEQKKHYYDFYLAHTDCINNWDLVDTSAPYIVGAYLWGKPTTILTKLAQSTSLWERRIAMIATFYFIRQQDHRIALTIATLLQHDPHDLIHKAVGWMLREIGKNCGNSILEQYLDTYAKTMPRTMLRYAIEKLPPSKRLHYLSLYQQK